MSNWEKKVFDDLWEQAKAMLKEGGVYEDFKKWQKVHGVKAKSKPQADGGGDEKA